MTNVKLPSQNLPSWDSAERMAKRPNWTPVSHQVVFDNPWIRLESHDVTAPTGKLAHYGLVRFRNRAIAVLPLFEDGTVPLVGQARFATGAYSWEIPEGGAPLGEDPLDGGKRELREECGMEASDWHEILNFDMSNSVTDEVAICYLAMGLTPACAEPDETEVFEHARVPFKNLLEAVINGQIRDGLTVVTVLRVYHMAVTGALPAAIAELII